MKMNNKDKKVVLIATIGLITLSAVGYFGIKATYTDKFETSTSKQELIDVDKEKAEKEAEEALMIEENLAKSRLENARKDEEEAKKQAEKEAEEEKEKNNSPKLEGSLDVEADTPSKPSKNNTQSSTNNTNKPSKDKPIKKPIKPSKPSEDSNNSSNDDDNDLGFSKDEIIQGGENQETISPGGSGDDTPVGEM